jgi:hypothetical protein
LPSTIRKTAIGKERCKGATMMKMKPILLTVSVSLLLLVNTAAAQTTAFTYQGKLTDSGNFANGSYDLQFKLFDALAAGTQQGSTQTLSPVAVTGGIFTVQLDFGVCAVCFNGTNRFLEIAVRPTGGGSFTTLSPRQPITSTPYAMKTTNLTFNGAFNDGTTIFTASNTFAGDSAGLNTTPDPSITGLNGKFNAFFGAGAGRANTSGGSNAFFGALAGKVNTTGIQNAFFGTQAGNANTTGVANAFFGALAGFNNTTGQDNAFFGESAGFRNTTGQNNTFIGDQADFDANNPTGNFNTLLGAFSRVTSGVSNATAIGTSAQVAQSNALVLGSINGVSATADTNVGIGTTTPGAILDVQRDGNTIPETVRFTTYGFDNKILSRASGGTRANPTATPNDTMLLQLGATGHNGNGFVTAPRAAIDMTAAEAWAPGAAGTLMRFNTTASGTTQILTRMTIADDGNVGIGTTTPIDRLEVNGIIRVDSLGSGSTISLCRNSSFQISNCSSSIRYKTNVATLPSGLRLIQRLRSVIFTWKADQTRDLGLIAEEVAKVEPLLTFRNEKGEIEGVKYDRVTVVLLKAVKEQQGQIERQQHIIERQQQEFTQQQRQLESLRKVVCLDHPQADICK